MVNSAILKPVFILPINNTRRAEMDKAKKTRREAIESDIKDAKEGQHHCNNRNCLITKVTPIALNITTEEGAELLVDLVHFCYDQIKLFAKNGDYIAMVGSKAEDITVEDFQQLLEKLEKQFQGKADDPKKKWAILAKEAGQDQKAILALIWLLNLIVAIETLIETLKERKRVEKARLN